MGKLLEFSIVFTSIQQAVYTPGQTIDGVVVVNLNNSMKMRALKLHFKGRAYVYWKERHRERKKNVTRHYRASETYFDTIIFLAGKESGGFNENTLQLSAGRSEFPFTFQLPPNLPSSFEGRHGFVRYFLKATIDKPWRFDHTTKIAFTVLNPLDLNLNPSCKNSVSSSNSKTLCCFCCASGPIQTELYLDRGGYVPGEFIFISGSVENLSSRVMESTKAELIMTVKYYARGKTKTTRLVVASVRGPGCQPKSSIDWNNERLQIPPLPSSMLEFCRIIDIFYAIQFVVIVPFGSLDLRTEVPITIGSIPLNDLTPFRHPVPALNPASTTPPSYDAPPSGPVNISSFQPPPSYAAAIGDRVNIKDDDDNDYVMGPTSFSPQYAYYDWSQSAFTYS